MNSQNIPFYKIINSRITAEELQEKPLIIQSLVNDKKLRLEFLSPIKPNIVDINAYKNKKHRDFLDNLNEFKKIYYKDYKINEHALDKIYKISEENTKFFQGFEGYNKRTDKENQKKVLSDVQDAYRKKDGYVPIIKENTNLFSNSILLQNDNDLKKYISMDLDAIKNDASSLSFLANIKENITPTKNKLNEIIKRCNTVDSHRYSPNKKDVLSLFASTDNDKKANKKHNKKISPKEKIHALKKDIRQTMNTYRSINDINFFLNSDNTKYLNLLNQKASRQSSGVASTRINSGINDFNKAQIRLQTSPEKENKNVKKVAFTEERISSLKRDNTVILPKINNFKSNKDLKKCTSKLEENEEKEEKFIRNYKHRYTKPDEVIKIYEPNYSYGIIKKTNSTKKNWLLKKNKSPVEELYEKVLKNDDFTEYNLEVINYLKKNRYDVKPQINEKNLYRSVERNREKIINNTCLKKIMKTELSSNSNSVLNNKIIKYNDKAKKDIELAEERLISILADLNGGK